MTTAPAKSRPGSSMRVLCIDDEPEHAELLRRALMNAGLDVTFTHRIDEASVAVEGQQDLIFVDFRLGADTGVEVIARLRARGCDAPIVMLTARGDEYVAIDATRAGADDYLCKMHIGGERLLRAIERARARAIDRRLHDQLSRRVEKLEAVSSALADANVELALDARTDVLTGVVSRRAWMEMLEVEHTASVRADTSFAIIMIDVDRFKLYNDTAGHQAGDECLRRIAAALGGVCRGSDALGRIGGEEFAVLLPGASVKAAEAAAQRMLDAVHRSAIPHPALRDAVVTASFGVAVGPVGDGGDATLAAADGALYAAKVGGRARVATAA